MDTGTSACAPSPFKTGEEAPAVPASNNTDEADSKECNQEENLKVRQEKERKAARIALEKVSFLHPAPSLKRVYPFKTAIAVREEVCVKRRLSEETKRQPISFVAVNKTGEADSKENYQKAYLHEKERKAAKSALEKMENTAMIYDNHKSYEELELLVLGCPSDIFQTLGLLLKHEFYTEVEEKEEEEEEEEEIVDVQHQPAIISSSPDQKSLRAERMKKRFSDTILKATQKMEEMQHGKAEVSSTVESKKSKAENLRKIEVAKLKMQIQQEKQPETARIALQRLYARKRTRYRCPGKDEVEEGEIVC